MVPSHVHNKKLKIGTTICWKIRYFTRRLDALRSVKDIPWQDRWGRGRWDKSSKQRTDGWTSFSVWLLTAEHLEQILLPHSWGLTSGAIMSIIIPRIRVRRRRSLALNNYTIQIIRLSTRFGFLPDCWFFGFSSGVINAYARVTSTSTNQPERIPSYSTLHSKEAPTIRCIFFQTKSRIRHLRKYGLKRRNMQTKCIRFPRSYLIQSMNKITHSSPRSTTQAHNMKPSSGCCRHNPAPASHCWILWMLIYHWTRTYRWTRNRPVEPDTNNYVWRFALGSDDDGCKMISSWCPVTRLQTPTNELYIALFRWSLGVRVN